MTPNLALVDQSASIGEGTKVWQFASVIRGAKIGRDCSVAACAIVDGAEIGDRVLIGHSSSVHPGSKVGSDVFIGPSVVICNDRWPRVAKDGFEAERLFKGFVTVEIEDGVSVGAGAVILPGVKIGKGAFIAAGSVVIRSVPAAHLHKRNGSITPLSPRNPARLVEAGCFT